MFFYKMAGSLSGRGLTLFFYRGSAFLTGIHMPKIKYGIDLGTTNSSIATISDNNPSIFKTDTNESVMPSCVSFSKSKTVRVGVQALNDYQSEKKTAVMSWKTGKSNAFVEFKRGMGSDTAYESSYMKRSFSAEELSAEVLKKLKTFVPENIADIVYRKS